MKRHAVFWLILSGLLLSVCGHARAQEADDQDKAGEHHRNGSSSSPTELVPLKPVALPRQRLEAGALLCQTEAELRQHQAAVMARLAGREAQEPGGCRILREMVAVAVVQRHGLALTEVRLHTTPEEVGWTDSMVRDQPPAFGK